MFVLLVWGAAAVAAVIILVVLGYELFGHLRRLRRAAQVARDDLLPQLAKLQRLRPPAPPGRHRAGVPRL